MLRRSVSFHQPIVLQSILQSCCIRLVWQGGQKGVQLPLEPVHRAALHVAHCINHVDRFLAAVVQAWLYKALPESPPKTRTSSFNVRRLTVLIMSALKVRSELTLTPRSLRIDLTLISTLSGARYQYSGKSEGLLLNLRHSNLSELK